MSDAGYGKEGGELKNFNCVKGKPGQEKGKYNKKKEYNQGMYL